MAVALNQAEQAVGVGGPIELHLTVAEQRKLCEAEKGEPCFRMWLSKAEYDKGAFADWTAYPLSDGRVAVWRKESDLRKLQANGEIQLWTTISERRLTDDVA